MYNVSPSTVKSIRQLERTYTKMCRQNVSILFNEIRINEETQPKYTHTHTHTHTHIRTHIYIYIYVIIINIIIIKSICWHGFSWLSLSLSLSLLSPSPLSLSPAPIVHSTIGPGRSSRLYPTSEPNCCRLVLFGLSDRRIVLFARFVQYSSYLFLCSSRLTFPQYFLSAYCTDA